MSISFAGRDPLVVGLDCEADVVLATGAMSARAPLRLSPGRDGFGPNLALSYTSSGANSPFGVGWALDGILSVTIDTRTRLPAYDGADQYAFAGMPLVPEESEGPLGWRPVFVDKGAFLVRRFRARVDEARIRVEEWREKATGQVHWRSRDAANTLTIYGLPGDGANRVADPSDDRRVVAWLPEIQIDARGNAIVFSYAKETRDGVDRASAAERSRLGNGKALPQRYLKSIRYGNSVPVSRDGMVPPGTQWHFETVFDYGDHADFAMPSRAPDQPWSARPDPYSSYRSGFEVRTWRLCRRVLMFHHFAHLAAEPVLVGIHALEHDLKPEGATLTAIGYEGLRRDPANGAVTRRAAPPQRFTYSQPAAERNFRAAPQETLENLPSGLAGAISRWIDHYGEGLPGILTETRDGWYFKRNEGGGRFGPQQLITAQPKYRLAEAALNDFDADGNLNVAVLHGRVGGYYQRDRVSGQWSGFRTLAALPHQEAAGGRARWLDLDGDGRLDLVVAGRDRLVWYPAHGKDGFADPIEVSGGAEDGPPVTEETRLGFFLADMTGGGAADQVRVRNGRIEYWPNLGHGHFGAPVVMDDAPVFGPDSAFDAGRILLCDLDGDGAADLIYVGAGEVRTYINAEGNAWRPGVHLTGLPVIDNNASLKALDFLGDGTPCLVWSNALPGRAASIHYLPLAGPERPNLLVAVDNGLGREIHFAYESSARHYLMDRREQRPWRTLLPNHVTVVARHEVIDYVTGSRLTRRFRYHDGAYDGDERQFRGFAQVDRYDTPARDAVDGEAPPRAEPSYVRTYFHAGDAADGGAPGAWQGDPLFGKVPAAEIVSNVALSAAEHADAYRALAGRMVRREVFALDSDGSLRPNPFQVVATGYRVSRVQPARGGRTAVFTVQEAQTLTAAYEQESGDPRVHHELVLETDAYGNEALTATIDYARRASAAPASPQQAKPVVTVRRTRLANIAGDERYELGLPVEEQIFEVRLPAVGEHIPSCAAAKEQISLAIAVPVAFHESLTSSAAPAARLISWDQSFYWDDAGVAALPLGAVGTAALPHSSIEACFTPAFVEEVYGARVAADRLMKEGGYELRHDYWWRRSAVSRYASPADFRRIVAIERPDGAASVLAYDPARLFLVEARDPLGNVTSAEIDYYALAPWRIVDPNGNAAEVRYDALGVIVASTMVGSVADAGGAASPYGQEPIAAFAPPASTTIAGVIADPAAYVQDVAQAVWYDIDAWRRDGTPIPVVTLVREGLVHEGAAPPADTSGVHVAVAHMDAFGRPLQSKVLVEGGPAIQRAAGGAVLTGADGLPVLADAPQRWLASGHVVYDEREQPVQQFEPFFTPDWRYESDASLANFGVSSVTRYDALVRAVRTDLPNGAFTSTEYGAWEIRSYDANDTVGGSAYRVMRDPLPADHPEKRALVEALAHNDTPSVAHLDPRGLTVRQSVTAAGGAPVRSTETLLDAAGQAAGVIDARGLDAFAYQLDMAGRALSSRSNDAGESLVFLNIYDQPIDVWDARGAHQRRAYDALDRVVSVRRHGPPGFDTLVEQFVYGEDASVADAPARNLRGRLAVRRDSAGVQTILTASPLGQPLVVERRVREGYKTEVDWSDPAAVALMPESWVTRARFDALGRVVEREGPDGAIRRYRHLKGGGAAELRVTIAGAETGGQLIFSEARFNARGQRERVLLGNGVEIVHDHDPLTFRTTRIRATRSPPGGGAAALLQDLAYTYDPAGNIVRIADAAQDTGALQPLVRNLAVTSEQEFSYDAFYQLRHASGRVHRALLEHDYRSDAPGAFRGGRMLSLNDGGAVDRYTRHYEYDLAGNLTRIRHVASRSWTTDMWVAADSNRSLPARDANGFSLSDPATRFDAAGNCAFLPHLVAMDWDWRGLLVRAVMIDRSAGGGPDDAEYYVYDGEGQRARKVTERLVGGAVEVTEKIYLDGCEIKRVSRDGARVLERIASRLGDDDATVAFLHRWTMDAAGRETDDIARPRWVYQLSNHLGSSRLDLDERGGVIAYEEYFPFGGAAFIAGDDMRAVALRDYRFSGKERDDLTGFYYFGFRYYAPWIARWLTPDPIGASGGVNLYQYVLNNPVNLVDPDGLDPQRPGQRLRTRHVTFEQLRAGVPAEHELGAGARFVGLAVPAARGGDFVMYRSERELREAAARAGPGAVIVIYDPEYERLRGLGYSEREAAEAAEILHNVNEALEGFTPPNYADDMRTAGQQLADWGGGGAGAQNQSGTGTGAGGSDQPAGGEHGEDGTGGAGTGPGNAPGDSNGQGGSSDTGANASHSGDGSNAGGTAPGGSTGRDGVGSGAGGAGNGRGGGGRGNGAGTGGQGTGAGAGNVGGGRGRTARTGRGAGPGGGGGTGAGGRSGGSPGGAGNRGRGASQGTGSEPGGAPGGVRGGVEGGVVGATGEGTPSGAGSPPGGADPNGTATGAPGQATGNTSGDGAAGGANGAEGGGSQRPDGQGRGGQQGAQGEGGQGRAQPESLMDRLTRYAGYWHLEFGGDGQEGASSGGIPGAFGSVNGGAWAQGMFLFLTAVDIVLTVLSLGSLAALKVSLKLALRATALSLRRLASSAAKLLTREGLHLIARRAVNAISRFGRRLFGVGRNPIIVDADVLVKASSGARAALAEIRAGVTHITPSQLREFLDVSTNAQRLQRLAFLAREGIEELSPRLAQLTTKELRTLFWTIARGQASTADAALIVFARTTSMTVVTAEKRLFNFITKTLKLADIDIRRLVL